MNVLCCLVENVLLFYKVYWWIDDCYIIDDVKSLFEF